MDFLLRGNAAAALVAAVVWGGGDFAGGIAVKVAGGSMRAAFRVLLLSHGISMLMLLALSSQRGGAFPTGANLAWGIVAGLLAALSLAAFYVSLSGGAMGAAAALSGLLAAAIPAGVSFFTEGLPGPLRLLGILIAGAAIWLIAGGSEPNDAAGPRMADRRAMTLAIVAGIGFGLYFVSMKMAGRGGLLWPMTIVRMSSAATCAVLVLATIGRSREPVQESEGGLQDSVYLPRRALLWAMGPALLDTGANLLFMASTRMGRLDVASVLASLYPASTILLAAWMLHERPTRRQGLGMLTAAAAVVMITI